MLYLYMKKTESSPRQPTSRKGRGKTTTAAHVAVAAAQNHDLNTPFIDLAGTQNDLATHFGISIDEESIDAPIRLCSATSGSSSATVSTTSSSG